MVSVEDRAAEVAVAAGLRATGRKVFGRYRAHPVAVNLGGAMQNGRVSVRVGISPEAAPAVQGMISNKAYVKSLKLSPMTLGLDMQTSILFYTIVPGALTPKSEAIVRTLATLTGLAARAGSNPGELCDNCRQNPGTAIIVNDAPTQLCPACFQEMAQKFGQVSAVAATFKPDYAKGLAFGLLGALIGGAIWGGIGVATGYIFGLVAFVNGIIVAWFLTKGAGMVTVPIIVAGVGFTLLSVFIGDVIAIAVITGADLATVIAIYPEFLAPGPGTALIGYFFAAFGVLASVQALRRAKKAQTPRFEVVR